MGGINNHPRKIKISLYIPTDMLGIRTVFPYPTVGYSIWQVTEQ